MISTTTIKHHLVCTSELELNHSYNPTVLVIIQKTRETSANILRYWTVIIVQYRARAHPVILVVFFQVTEKGWKKLSWIINLLLDVSVWSIAVYFYGLCCILTSPHTETSNKSFFTLPCYPIEIRVAKFSLCRDLSGSQSEVSFRVTRSRLEGGSV